MADLPILQLSAGSALDADGGAESSITFIGTATVVLRLGPFTILTDPNFLHRGQRAYVGMGLSTKRLTDPAVEIEDLPPIDFIVLSHHHADHFDRVAAAELDKGTPIITEPHAAKKLSRQGFRRPIALSTWDRQVVAKGEHTLRVTSMPGRHAPEPLQRVVPPVMGSLIEVLEGERVALALYITGDTLYYKGLEEIAARYHDIDVCLLHLGGTKALGVLLTMDGDQGVKLLRLVKPGVALPVHYDDYTLFKSPLSDFTGKAEAAGLATSVVTLAKGTPYPLPRRKVTT